MKEIVVIEDDDGIRELLQLVLQSQNYKVKAFAKIRTFNHYMEGDQTPDLFLLDYMLPDGNGLDVCHRLKDENDTKMIPVIIMSAHAELNKMKGADNYIAKPFDIEELTTCIKRHIK